MTGDAAIGQMREILQREAAGKNGVQAGSWRDLQMVFTVFGDALQRHASALEQSWPRTNSAANAFLAHVDDLLQPLQSQAVVAAADNSTAIASIEDAAKAALTSMDMVYSKSVAINQKWDKLASQPQGPDSTEIALLKQQSATFGAANTVIEGYKTDVAQTTMTEPPTYRTPLPPDPQWAAQQDAQIGPSGRSRDSQIIQKSGEMSTRGGSATPAVSTSNIRLGGSLPPVALPREPSLTSPAPAAPPPTGDTFIPPAFRPPPRSTSVAETPSHPSTNAPEARYGSHPSGASLPNISDLTALGHTAPRVIGALPEETAIRTGNRAAIPAATPALIGDRPTTGAIQAPVTGTANRGSARVVGAEQRGNSAGSGLGRGPGQVSARVRGLEAKGEIKGLRGVLDDPSCRRSATSSGSRRSPRSTNREYLDDSYENDELWTVPHGTPPVVEPKDELHDVNPGLAFGR